MSRFLRLGPKILFVALQYAIDLGLILDRLVSGKQLEIRDHRANPERPSWIWKYGTGRSPRSQLQA